VAELNHDKYIVFNRKEFVESLANNSDFHALEDAVVIRRQDLFASPCLLTYATMITMVAQHHSDEKVKAELQIIADYFHNQGVLAGEEGWKLPTP
jgi:hypothetical protein